MGKLLASYVAKVDANSKPSVLVESDIIDEPESKVVENLEPKVEVSY